MVENLAPLPAHVAEGLVFDLDFYNAPELLSEPHHNLLALLRNTPEVFWTRRNGGHWVVARIAPALEMLRDPVRFSSAPQFNAIYDRWPRLAPNQYDPPEQTQFRAILEPWFTPTAVRRREAEIRALAAELIERVLARGSCEFVSEIAEQFSVIIFLRMVDAPPGDAAHMLDMAARWTRGAEQAGRDAALQDLARYLNGLLAARRSHPGDDLLSHMLRGTIDGRPLNADELLGLITLTFLGGLDTVYAMLSFIMSFLARNPGHYRRLVEDPPFIARAINELMRVHGVAGMERGATGDFTFRGVRFARGDRIVFIPQMLGIDDRYFTNSEAVDYDRANAMNLVFGAGVHRCIGANLARAELRIFLEEWVARIPAFRAEDGPTARTRGGLVWSVETLPLAW